MRPFLYPLFLLFLLSVSTSAIAQRVNTTFPAGNWFTAGLDGQHIRLLEVPNSDDHIAFGYYVFLENGDLEYRAWEHDGKFILTAGKWTYNVSTLFFSVSLFSEEITENGRRIDRRTIKKQFDYDVLRLNRQELLFRNRSDGKVWALLNGDPVLPCRDKGDSLLPEERPVCGAWVYAFNGFPCPEVSEAVGGFVYSVDHSHTIADFFCGTETGPAESASWGFDPARHILSVCHDPTRSDHFFFVMPDENSMLLFSLSSENSTPSDQKSYFFCRLKPG